MLITHDLGLAAEYCDRIVVMHAGHMVEVAPTTEELFAGPRHPYTARLIAATPRPGVTLDELAAIPGGLPDLRRDAAGLPLPRALRAVRGRSATSAAAAVRRGRRATSSPAGSPL